jgi:hypothetical protein
MPILIRFRSLFLVLLAIASVCRADGPSDVRESWESLYMGATKVGYAHTIVDKVEADKQTVWRAAAKQRFEMKRFNDKIEMEIEFVTYETDDGRLYAFDSTLRQSGKDIVSKGRLEGDKMKLSFDTLGNKQEQSLEWGDDVVGLAKLDQEMRAKPLKKDEVRKAKTFYPGVNQIVVVTYTGLGPKKTTLLDKKDRELFAVKMEQSVAGDGGAPLPATEYYVDKDGETLKSEIPLMPGLPVTSYKCSRSEALAGSNSDEPGVDFGFASLLKVEGLKDARQKKAITYKLTFKDEAAARAFPSSGGQKVTSQDGNVLTVRVERRTPPPNAKAGPAAEEFLQPNGFIQSDDAEIVKVARAVGEPIADPWKRCQSLEKWVDENMKSSDFTVGFSTAADTIRSRRGDCSEHSVLLTALCRAAGVPSRAAMGLVYVESLHAFGYHMWTEVNIGGEWYALDGTIGEGSVGGEHLKILDGSLKGASAMGALLPIFQVMGKLEIKVEGVE